MLADTVFCHVFLILSRAAAPSTIYLEQAFTPSLSSRPCHISLHLPITSPMSPTPVHLCGSVLVRLSQGFTTHPSCLGWYVSVTVRFDHPHLYPFHIWINTFPRGTCFALIQLSALNLITSLLQVRLFSLPYTFKMLYRDLCQWSFVSRCN